jgi:hypothetical protein
MTLCQLHANHILWTSHSKILLNVIFSFFVSSFQVLSAATLYSFEMVRWLINDILGAIVTWSMCIHEFSWTYWGNIWETSVRIVGVPAQIRTQQLLNMCLLEHCRYANRIVILPLFLLVFQVNQIPWTWRCVVRCKFADVSEEHSAFIFRVDNKPMPATIKTQAARGATKCNTNIFCPVPLSWKNKSRFMLSPCCLCVCVPPFINFWMPELIFIKLRMYIMAPETISTAYFINPSPQSLCVSS